MDWMDLASLMEPRLRAGDLAWCLQRVSEELATSHPSPFQRALGMHFTNDPAAVGAALEGVVRAATTPAALYVEMNGFDINPDRWYADCFAFDQYGGHEDYDWLADWAEEAGDAFTLTGMEDLQAIYADEDAFSAHPQSRDLASLLVVLKFQDLVRRGVAASRLTLPVLSTAHDYDFIAEVRG